jgi:hypothetical protein
MMDATPASTVSEAGTEMRTTDKHEIRQTCLEQHFALGVLKVIASEW